jgi:hypothetical protein
MPQWLAKTAMTRSSFAGRLEKWHEVAVFDMRFEHPYTNVRGRSMQRGIRAKSNS